MKYINSIKTRSEPVYDPYMMVYQRDDETPLAIVQEKLQGNPDGILKPATNMRRRVLHAAREIAKYDNTFSEDTKLINRKHAIIDGRLLQTKRRVVIDESKNTVKYIDRIVIHNTDLRNLWTNDRGYYL